MTAQIQDIVRYNGKDYNLVGGDDEELFEPTEHGIEPFSGSTACWRGFQAIYKVADGQFLLDELHFNMRGNPPSLNGKKPSKSKSGMFQHEYAKLGLKVEYTGTLIIGRDFIDSMYVHMGFHGADCYKDVVKFELEKGNVKESKDISEQMEQRRREGRDCKPRSPFDEEGGDGDIDKWIQERFSRKIE